MSTTVTQSAEPLIQVIGVAKHWDASSGLAPIWLDLCPGEVVVLRGRSGSGKSTLLALLVGWCAADSGEIRRIGEWAETDRWRQWRSTAIVPQVLGLADELSVAENLEHVLRLAGRNRRERSRAERREMVDQTLDALDLREQAGRLPREISLGQQQRVAVGRATIATPTILLADEPTCHQDPLRAGKVVAALRTVAAPGGSVLITSHDPAIAEAADRVVSLDD